jgi:hypothetical protein
VSSHHQQKICLSQQYPCPCHRQGQLQQIVLTEAFGCNRCQRIFVLKEDGCTIEELATNYPYQRRYYWNGVRWQLLRPFADSRFERLRQWAVWGLFTFGGLLQPRDGWVLWLLCLGLVVLLLPIFQLYRRLATASSLFGLGLPMTIATIVLIVTILWLSNQR